MKVRTTRFGEIEVDPARVIEFPKGILGFPLHLQYVLIQTSQESCFYWLQAADVAELAFVVCDPRLFVPDYQVPVRREDMEAIGLSDVQQAQVFVIVNKVGDQLTANLQGPLLINVHNRKGCQLVLSDKKYSTRHPLMKLPVSRSEPVAQTA